jgi:hypothetical protein
MRSIARRVLTATIAICVCTSVAFGASEALATSKVTSPSKAICPTTNGWAGECGAACNKTCVSRGYAEGACINYSPTKLCCRCVF